MLVVPARYLVRRIACKERIRTIFLSNVQRDDDDPKTKAAKKLNSLLLSIIKDDTISKDEDPQKIVEAQTKFKKRKIKKEEKPKNLGEKIVEAARDVAENIKGEPEVTEAQLLEKVLHKNENLQKTVLNASRNKTLSELISSMKVEQEPDKTGKQIKDSQYNRAEHIRSLRKEEQYPRRQQVSFGSEPEERIDLFGGRPLGIFQTTDIEDEVKLDIWNHCQARELRLTVTHPPSNIYEQMIIWTDRGMLWKFPIDNEQGLEEERKVSFADHIFLETYLEDWCPPRGPIRHFMELVCVGLSRNYWLTAKEKKSHILWYKEYFLQKKELIKELGAGDFQIAAASS